MLRFFEGQAADAFLGPVGSWQAQLPAAEAPWRAIDLRSHANRALPASFLRKQRSELEVLSFSAPL